MKELKKFEFASQFNQMLENADEKLRYFLGSEMIPCEKVDVGKSDEAVMERGRAYLVEQLKTMPTEEVAEVYREKYAHLNKNPEDMAVETEEENIILEAWRLATENPDDATEAIRIIGELMSLSGKVILAKIYGRDRIFKKTAG